MFDSDDDPTQNDVAWFLIGDFLLHFVFFSLIIVKSLQFRGHRQIAESHKYCLVRVIFFFFSMCFLYFVSHKFGKFVLIPYNWYQSLGLGLSGSNGRGSGKVFGIEKFDGTNFGFWRMQIEDYL